MNVWCIRISSLAVSSKLISSHFVQTYKKCQISSWIVSCKMEYSKEFLDFIYNPTLFLIILNAIFYWIDVFEYTSLLLSSVNLCLLVCAFKSLNKKKIVSSRFWNCISFVSEITVQSQCSFRLLSHKNAYSQTKLN